MPELPDVQVFKEYLDATALHQTIERATVSREEILENVSPRAIQRRLKGRELESTSRHGKYLFAKIHDDGWLVLHFGMTGYLKYSETDDPPEHTRLLLQFENGAFLAYTCMRMLGKVSWTKDVEDFCRQEKLGVDALSEELDFAKFQELIGSKRGSIKSALMDQKTIAGLGNVYVDEILFQAQVHPQTPVGDLAEKTLRKIHRQLPRVLKAAIRARAQPDRLPKSFLLPRRDQKEATCPRCDAPIETVKVGGRTSHYCPSCQPS